MPRNIPSIRETIMERFSRLLVLIMVSVMLLLQVPPAACKGKPDSTSSVNEGKGKNKNKKNRKKSSAPMSAPSPIYASEGPNRSTTTNFPASQKKSTSPTSTPSQLIFDEKSNAPTNRNLRNTDSSGSPSSNPAGTPTSASNRSSDGSDVTVTASPSSSNSFPEEETPTIAPIEFPTFDDSVNEQIPTVPIPSPAASKIPNYSLPTRDQSQKFIEDPTVDITTATGRSEKSAIMLVSLVALLGVMVTIVVWQLKNRHLRSWEGVSDANAFWRMSG